MDHTSECLKIYCVSRGFSLKQSHLFSHDLKWGPRTLRLEICANVTSVQQAMAQKLQLQDASSFGIFEERDITGVDDAPNDRIVPLFIAFVAVILCCCSAITVSPFL